MNMKVLLLSVYIIISVYIINHITDKISIRTLMHKYDMIQVYYVAYVIAASL